MLYKINLKNLKLKQKKYYLEVNVEDLFILLAKISLSSPLLKIVILILLKIV